MVDLPWYVIAFSAVGINIPPGRDEYHGRLHSLWYGEIQEKGVYRWFEAGFMVSAIIPRRMTHVPAAMEPGENAGKALANAITEWQLALALALHPHCQGQETAFIERRLDWFAQAAAGALRMPSSMPEQL